MLTTRIFPVNSCVYVCMCVHTFVYTHACICTFTPNTCKETLFMCFLLHLLSCCFCELVKVEFTQLKICNTENLLSFSLHIRRRAKHLILFLFHDLRQGTHRNLCQVHMGVGTRWQIMYKFLHVKLFKKPYAPYTKCSSHGTVFFFLSVQCIK